MSSFNNLVKEINYHRTREIRSMNGETGSFLLVSSITFWTELFIHHFVSSKDVSHDDLLFFVRKTAKKGYRFIAQYDIHLEVFRKDSKLLPIGEQAIDWEETLYLNLIMQQFEYSLTIAVCTRTSPNELQILRKHTQRVFASPSRRSMQDKGENEEITYPNIFFNIDDYEELLDRIVIHDAEMVCVELVAKDRKGEVECVLFLGSIRYEALKRVYEARTSSSARFGKKKIKSYFQGQRIEFVRMKVPAGNGHAEAAVSKQKDANVETPTSEPGFYIGDFDECENGMEVIIGPSSNMFSSIFSACVLVSTDDQDNPYVKRRMSDPSNDLKNYIRGWKERRDMKKTKSENEGIDSFVDEISHVEMGDLRDELDDTSYNQLWTMKGFRQTFHFWRENKRNSSVALHCYITYITLPWHSIIGDLLGNTRQQPLLTF